MALFSRRKDTSEETGSAPEQTPLRTASDTVAELRPRRRTVGQLLRETRESFGSDIPRVAAALRIRAAYLEAIEEGRYDRLPGPVYALGFVRGYAVHLGLDGEEAVRRFKLEAEGFEAQRDLTFPVPLAERSVPGGAMVLAALILAVCGYGLWYYFSETARPRPERVDPVPAALITPPPSPSAAPAGAPPAEAAPPAAAAPAPAPAPLPPAPEPVVQPPSAALPPAAPSAASAPVLPPVSATPASVVTLAPPPPPSAAVTNLPAAEPGPPPAPPPAAEASPPPVPALAQTAALPPPAPSQPHEYGLANGLTRIVIRAVSESWIQVRDQDKKAIFTRKLLPGDTYHVPDEPGLTLATGLGTGLAFTVDGRQTPPIGGAVRKNIILDPDRLLNGTARGD
jgi:cytoskeleton protein RodZ